MARVEAITSEDLVYQVTLTGRTRGRDTEEVWTGLNISRFPPTPFEPRGVDKTRSGIGEFIDPVCRFTAANGRLNYGYGLICYDFRTNNEGRRDFSGRPEQRMKDVKRIQSAELTFQVSAIADRTTAFYIACLPKISLVSIRGNPLTPHPLQLGMNYFLGYNEVYWNPIRNEQVGTERYGSGNINPACIAGLTTNRYGMVEPFIFTDRDSYPSTVTVRLRPRMLRALEQAMRNGDVFGLAAVPLFGFGEGPGQFTANTGLNFWNGTTLLRRDITNGIKIRSGLNASYNPPKLTYRYAIDDSRKNAGFNPGGACASGFSDGANISAGSLSGFFDF